MPKYGFNLQWFMKEPPEEQVPDDRAMYSGFEPAPACIHKGWNAFAFSLKAGGPVRIDRMEPALKP
jgi:hypothetical protein